MAAVRESSTLSRPLRASRAKFIRRCIVARSSTRGVIRFRFSSGPLPITPSPYMSTASATYPSLASSTAFCSSNSPQPAHVWATSTPGQVSEMDGSQAICPRSVVSPSLYSSARVSIAMDCLSVFPARRLQRGPRIPLFRYSVRAGGQATEARFLRDSPVSCAMAVTESRGRRGLQFRSASGVAPWSVNPVADAKSIARRGRAVCVAGLQGGRIWPEPSQPSCNRIVESNDSQLIRPSTSAARHCAPGRQGGTSEATKAETRPCRSARVSGYNRGTGAQHERYPRGRDRHQARMACRIRRGHAATTRPPAQVRIRTHAHTQAG